jgi:DNA invertase Pin-like site-specific DNA recombinase
MMLGIRFVFSKQYSDKLSEDITRGKNSSVAKGKSQGKYKYGYYRDPADGYDKPHPKYFPLMKEAFQMKLYM